jgi:hypothetical protein
MAGKYGAIGWYPGPKRSVSYKANKKHIARDGGPLCGAKGKHFHVCEPESEWFKTTKEANCSRCIELYNSPRA